jgi:hypothetical protein
VSRGSDGATTAFLRNPDRNIGVFWDIERVEQTGDRVQLIGKFRGRGEPRVFGTGVYDADDKRLSIYFAERGGTFDFAEEYFHGFHRGKPNDTRSGAKSVTATLVGAAIRAGASSPRRRASTTCSSAARRSPISIRASAT